jgi:hypothetical protein
MNLTAQILENQKSILIFQEEVLMKTKSAVITSCLVGVISATTMPLSAMEINSAISGTGHSLGIGFDGDPIPLGGIQNTVNIKLKKNGKKSKNPHDRSTAISNSQFNPIPTGSCDNALGAGAKLEYIYSTGVSTDRDGDLIFAEMVTGEDNFVCYTPVDPYYFEVTIHREITGGTGKYEGACGWLEFKGSGNFLIDPAISQFNAFEGSQVGELLLGSDCD